MHPTTPPAHTSHTIFPFRLLLLDTRLTFTPHLSPCTHTQTTNCGVRVNVDGCVPSISHGLCSQTAVAVETLVVRIYIIHGKLFMYFYYNISLCMLCMYIYNIWCDMVCNVSLPYITLSFSLSLFISGEREKMNNSVVPAHTMPIRSTHD